MTRERHSLARRSLLRGLAAVPLISLPGVIVAGAADAAGSPTVTSPDPIPALVEEFYDLDRRISVLIDSEPEADCDKIEGYTELEDRREDIVVLVVETEASSFAGMQAKARMLAHDDVQQDLRWMRGLANSLHEDMQARLPGLLIGGAA